MLPILPQALFVAIFNMPTSYWARHRSSSDPMNSVKRILQPKIHSCIAVHQENSHSKKPQNGKRINSNSISIYCSYFSCPLKQYRTAKHKHSAAVGPSKIHRKSWRHFPHPRHCAVFSLLLKAQLLQKEVLLLLQSHHLNCKHTIPKFNSSPLKRSSIIFNPSNLIEKIHILPKFNSPTHVPNQN